jgi:hypothetical protein
MPTEESSKPLTTDAGETIRVSTSILITDSFEGFHCWPDAPEPVAFLRVLHRHKFGINVRIATTHADRQVEFFIAKNDLHEVLTLVKENLMKNPSASCETMAEAIGYAMHTKFKYNVMSVTVSEDQENAGVVEFLYQ